MSFSLLRLSPVEMTSWTHCEVCRCGDVGGVERIQSASSSHVQKPGLFLQQQGAVVLRRAGETGTAQQTCTGTTDFFWLHGTTRCYVPSLRGLFICSVVAKSSGTSFIPGKIQRFWSVTSIWDQKSGYFGLCIVGFFI